MYKRRVRKYFGSQKFSLVVVLVSDENIVMLLIVL